VYFFGYSSTVSITQEEKKRQKLLEIFVVVDFFWPKIVGGKKYCEFEIPILLLYEW